MENRNYENSDKELAEVRNVSTVDLKEKKTGKTQDIGLKNLLRKDDRDT